MRPIPPRLLPTKAPMPPRHHAMPPRHRSITKAYVSSQVKAPISGHRFSKVAVSPRHAMPPMHYPPRHAMPPRHHAMPPMPPRLRAITKAYVSSQVKAPISRRRAHGTRHPNRKPTNTSGLYLHRKPCKSCTALLVMHRKPSHALPSWSKALAKLRHPTSSLRPPPYHEGHRTY